jgi:hypothetical protein
VSAGYNVEEWGPVHAIPTYHKAGAGARRAPFGTADRPIPLIIDSDPGLDDALAIGLAAASPEIELLAVTTVGGNADVTRCTENALRLLHAYGRDDVPVAEGAAGALLGSIVRATEVHGESGIGNTVLDPSPNAALPEGAVALIARILAGIMAGIAGSSLSLASAGSFQMNMSAGRGFIALAAVIFGAWNPVYAFGAALVFGFSDSAQALLSILGVDVPPQLLNSVPYLVTIIVVAGVVGRVRGPAAAGQPYDQG